MGSFGVLVAMLLIAMQHCFVAPPPLCLIDVLDLCGLKLWTRIQPILPKGKKGNQVPIKKQYLGGHLVGSDQGPWSEATKTAPV